MRRDYLDYTARLGRTIDSFKAKLYSGRSRMAHKPEAQAKADPSLAPQACVPVPAARSISSILASSPLLTPQVWEWALQQTTDGEIAAGLQEVRETGGTELGEVIQKLKPKRRDRPGF
jgi:hypothetical protein